MASQELRKLWKLNQIDSALLDIRKRAAALDPGKKIMGEIEALEKELASVGGRAKALTGKMLDLELQQRSAAGKIKQIEKDLYSGKIVNPREVEAHQKEIEGIKRKSFALDDRLLELMEAAPPAKAAATEIEELISKKKAELATHRKAALETKAKLESEFKRLSAARPEAAKEVEAGLLARYEAIKKNHDTGMAEVKKGFCGGCGNHLPEKTVETLKIDRVATCEQCHRILYYSEGLV